MAESQFSGQKWEYRNDTVEVGQLTPVSCYVVSMVDPTPASDEKCGHIWTGFVEVAEWEECPDPAYYGGMRREMRVRGPVVNRNRTVVIDDNPTCVLVDN